MDLTLGLNRGTSKSKMTEHQPSTFESRGTNVFRAGKDINIVIPQIEGSRNVFDAVLVSLGNKANEREVHSSSHGAMISTNPLASAALTAGTNFGMSDSYETHLNDAYIRGAVDFAHSQVRNQGCVVMNIKNAGASYEYIPRHEVHDSTSFAIGLSGLDLSSPDAFAYSLGRGLASAAASAGAGMLASEAGLGGFVSSLAASLAGSYVNGAIDEATGRQTTISETSRVEFERNGSGFKAVNVGFNKDELNDVINKIKSNIFSESLDANVPLEQAVEVMQREVEEVKRDITEFHENVTKVKKLAKKASAKEKIDTITQQAVVDERVIDLLISQNGNDETLLDQQIQHCFTDVVYRMFDVSPQDQMRMYVPKNDAEAALKEATLLRYKLEDLVARHPEAAELCSKMFVGAMYALQGVEYAVAGFTAGPLGIAAKFALQESSAFAIETTIEESSSRAAKLITQCETLQQEFQNTIKFCSYAGLCAGSVKAGKKLVSSLSKSTVERTAFNLTRYGGPGGGHHVHMKSAYKSHPLYDLNEALCLSKEEMVRLGIDHQTVTNAQRRMCIDLRKSGGILTREIHNDIQVRSLVEGGANEQLARDIVAKSQWDLRTKGIRSPTNMPYAPKGDKK